MQSSPIIRLAKHLRAKIRFFFRRTLDGLRVWGHGPIMGGLRYYFRPTWRYVQVGSADYDKAPRISVKKSHVHPQWKHTESGPVTTLLQNDIAILELYTPLNFTEKVQPICLPLEYREVPGEEGMIAGFGGHDGRIVICFQRLVLARLPI